MTAVLVEPYDYLIDGLPLTRGDDFAGTSPADWLPPCEFVEIDAEKRTALRGADRDIVWSQGQRHTPHKHRTGVDLDLLCLMSLRDVDGCLPVPKISQLANLHQSAFDLKGILSPGQHVLSRTIPVGIEVELDFEVQGEIDTATPRRRYAVPIHVAFPFWREVPAVGFSATFTGDGTLPIVVEGNVAVPNATITITANSQPATNVKVAHPTTGRFVQYSGTLAAGESAVIDVDEVTVTHSVDGLVDRFLTRAYADTLVLTRGSYSLAVTSDAGTLDYTVQVAFNNLRET